MSSTIAPARPNFAQQLRERNERRRLENLARYKDAARDVARGAIELSLEDVERLSAAVNKSIEEFEQLADEWQSRIDAAPAAETADAHRAAIESIDAELAECDRVYFEKRRAIEARQNEAKRGLRDAEHARRLLRENTLKLTPVAGALQRVNKDIRAAEHFIQSQKIKLTPEERDRLNVGTYIDEDGKQHFKHTGSDPELKGELKRREAELERKKDAKRRELLTLQGKRDALLQLALTAVPSQSDVDAILAGDVVNENEADD